MAPESRRPLIFDIHRYALDDGPGIRTTVFFKGCPLACRWCHNPEGIHPGPQLYYLAQRCLGCGQCATICPRQAIAMVAGPVIDRQRCDACGQCADQCSATALTIKGRYYSHAELLEVLLKDQRFFLHSGGGITFSGGEPTLYPDYLNSILVELKGRGVHVALQTCGEFDWQSFESELLPFVDLIYFDLKSMDAEWHRQWTGRTNQRILANFAKLNSVSPGKVICSIPLINQLTAIEENLSAIARYLGAGPVNAYQLRPYHPGGHFKATALGKSFTPGVPLHAMAPDQYHYLAQTFDGLVKRQRQRR